MRKKLASTLLAGALAASMAMPVFASHGGAIPTAEGTEVVAGIILHDKNCRIKVEVPTLFAFVVNGTVDTNDADGVSSGEGTILLPNVKVHVTESSQVSPGNPKYELEFVGNTHGDTLPFTNYSTYREESSSGVIRRGQEVTLNGTIKNEYTPIERNYWTHTKSDLTQPIQQHFKNYNVIIDNNNFDTAVTAGWQMAQGITIGAPDTGYDATTNSYDNLDSTDLAIIGVTHDAVFDVLVGGQRGQYNQVEQSAKIGTIVWTISVAHEGNDVQTAPDNEYLPPVN